MNEEAAKIERMNKTATEIIAPIMERVYEVAFDCMETFKSGEPEPKSVKIPFNAKEDVIEGLDEIIEHLKGRESYMNSASIIGYALGRDGMKPARQYRSMAAIAEALRDLIQAKDDQIKEELSGLKEHQERERIANMMGF